MTTADTQLKGRSRLVPRAVVEEAEVFLRELPKKEKEHLPLVEAITRIAEPLRDALDKGHSYEELAEMLSVQLGSTVSPWSLRRYVPRRDARQERRGSRKVKA